MQFVRLLLAAKANPYQTNASDGNALHDAAGASGPPEVIAMLVAAGVYVNQIDENGASPLFGVPPFHRQNALATLDALFTAGANPNQQDRQGNTPMVRLFTFSRADAETRAAMIKSLLDHGADPNISNIQDETALERAAMAGMAPTVDLLLAWGARLPGKRRQPLLNWVDERIAEGAGGFDAECNCTRDYRRIEAALKAAAEELN
jgi:ankyrin repeat protein